MLDPMKSTQLELLNDNRSGEKLEMVFMTFNEQERIMSTLSLYAAEFDVVILDGGSSDSTCDLVLQHGGTVYKRIGENVGENHFVYYVNNLTKSGRCFYMMCDEYVEIPELQKASKLLLEGEGQVFGRRIDWFYGIQARKPTCLSPKGFRRGDAAYDATNFHDTLSYARQSTKKIIVDVQHFHVYSMKDDYGKFGYYIYQEVLQLRKTASPIKSFFIRFLRLARNFQLGVVRFQNNKWIILFLLAQFFASFFLFIMSLIEQSKLSSKDEQLKQYVNKHFTSNK
jgi:glycosyltransferase involved in cell wall biosynthesis